MTVPQSSLQPLSALPWQKQDCQTSVQSSGGNGSSQRVPLVHKLGRCSKHRCKNRKGGRTQLGDTGSLAPMGTSWGEKQPVPLTSLKYTPVLLRLLALSPNPKRWLNLNNRRKRYLQCLAPEEEKLWWHTGLSHPLPLAVHIFLPSARTRWPLGWPLLPPQNVCRYATPSLQNGC